MEIAELLVEQEDLKKSDISHMDELTQYKILLIQLQNRQTREFSDLLYGSDDTDEKEDKLRVLHKLEEENFTKKQIWGNGL